MEEAGWKDSDGDGIREKDGKKLVVKWLTYPSLRNFHFWLSLRRQALKDIGIEVDINCTADNNSILEDPTAWDVYAMAMYRLRLEIRNTGLPYLQLLMQQRIQENTAVQN